MTDKPSPTDPELNTPSDAEIIMLDVESGVSVRAGKGAVKLAQTDSVQEDAARYRWLREGNDAKHGAAWHVAVNLYECEWDAAIDAARKQGDKP